MTAQTTTETVKTVTVDYAGVCEYMAEHFEGQLSREGITTVASHVDELIDFLGEYDEEADELTIDERTFRAVARRCVRVYLAGVDAARDAMMRAVREI